MYVRCLLSLCVLTPFFPLSLPFPSLPTIGIEEIYKDNASRMCRIKFFNALASHAVNAMWAEDDEKKKEAISQRAVGYFQRADRLDHQHPMTLVGKALMFMAKNEDDRAERFLKSVLISHKTNVPALLGKALLLYRRKKFADAKKLYLEAIKLHPRSPQASRMRMCFAYCCFHLGAVEKARSVMKYAASLDDTNVDAVIANAIWHLGSLRRDERVASIRDEGSRFMMMIHHAHAINKTNPTVLNHLANHYFAQWLPLPGTVSVVRGSAVVATSKDVSGELAPGQIVCIGDNKYVAYVSRTPGAVTATSITLDGPYRDESAPTASLSRKNYDKMFNLAGSAFHSTKIAEIRSESCYLMGRGCHAEGKYKDAYSYYFNAGRLWPNFVLPWFGLAQMYYERKEYAKAATYLEKANKAYPENVEILLLLGHVNGQLGKKDEAVVLLRRVVELEPGNVDALLGTAELLHGSPERKDQIMAISSYLAAEKVMKHAAERVPMELYVNLGVLQHRVGKATDALACFKKALKQQAAADDTVEVVDNDDDNDASGFKVPTPTEATTTVLYNMGLVLEEVGEREHATALYTAILAVFPKYIDCLLRLGCLLRDKGDEAGALRQFEVALELDPVCAEACLLQGNIHLTKREWSLAQKKFEKVMGMPTLKNDPYALLSMGNIFMSNLGEKNRYTKNMSLSEGYYKKTIQSHPANIYAANGLGIMVAEKGNFELAKQIFSQVREASPDMPDAWINLAHLFVAEERYAEAIQLYSVCLSKCYNGQDLEVLLYLAKAYYEAKNYPKCISTLSRAIHLRPDDLRLYYNIGLAQEDYAVATLGQEAAAPSVSSSSGGSGSRSQGTPRTMADVQRAIMDLKRAQRIFRFLLQQAEAAAVSATASNKKPTLPFDKEKVSEHDKYISDTLTKASYHLEFERQREEKRRLENEAQRQMLLEYEERVAQQQRVEKQREEDLKKRREDVLSKQGERLKQLSEGWRVREREEEKKVVKKRGGGGGKKRKKGDDDDEGAFIDNGSAEDDDDEDGGGGMSIEDMKNRNAKMKNLVDKRKKRARVDESSEDEDEAGGGGEKNDAADLFGSDSSDGEDDARGAAAVAAPAAAASPPPAVASPSPAAATVAPASSELHEAKNELFGSSSDEE